jgi:hypothetical protein
MRNTFLVLSFTLFTLTTTIHAQPDSLWSKTFNGGSRDGSYSLIQTSDGGYILAGYTYSSGSSDMWLVKTNEEGDSLWSRTFGGDGFERCYSILQSPNEGFVLVGKTSADMWLVRTDEEGDSLWSLTIGGDDADRCNSVIQTADGCYVLAGLTRSFGAGREDMWLVKTGPDPVSVPSESFNPQPSVFILQPAYPNPFNSSTNIRFDLPVNSDVSISIHDLNGRSVAKLLDDQMNAGNHSLTWDAKDNPAGLYLCRMEADGVNLTRKLLLIK